MELTDTDWRTHSDTIHLLCLWRFLCDLGSWPRHYSVSRGHSCCAAHKANYHYSYKQGLECYFVFLQTASWSIVFVVVGHSRQWGDKGPDNWIHLLHQSASSAADPTLNISPFVHSTSLRHRLICYLFVPPFHIFAQFLFLLIRYISSLL